jgi:hypothetical protein
MLRLADRRGRRGLSTASKVVAGAALVLLVGQLPASASFSNSAAAQSMTVSTGSISPPSGLSATPTCVAPPTITFRSASSNTGNVTSLAVNTPAGVQTDDVLIAAAGYRRDLTAASVTPPSGWTLVRGDSYVGQLWSQSIYYHVVTGTEPANYTWNVSTQDKLAIVIVAYSGVDSENPINANNGQNNANSTTITAPTVTPTKNNSTLLWIFGVRAAATITGQAGLTPRVSANTNLTPATSNASVLVAEETQTTAAATGTRTATADNGGPNTGAVVALTQASGSQAGLSWTATPTTSASGYLLTRTGPTKTFTYTISGASTTSAVNRWLTSGSSYTYSLQAYVGGWTSSAITTTITAC